MRDLDVSVVDEPARLAAADPDGFLRELAGAGAQVRRTAAAIEESRRADPSDEPSRATALIAPRIVADAVAALDDRRSSPLVAVSPADGLPRWVGAVDRVIVASAAGDDGALLAAAGDAGSRGARVVGVCPPGSPLAAVVAHARGAVVATAPAPWPRLGLWPMLIGAAWAAGAIGGATGEQLMDGLDRGAATLDEVAVACRPDRDLVVNPAKALAVALASSAAVVLTSSPLSQAAAGRCVEMALTAGQPVAVAAFEPGQTLGVLGGPFAPSSAPDDIFRDPVDDPESAAAHIVVLEDASAPTELRAMVDGLGRFRAGVTELAAAPELTEPLCRLAYWVATLDFAAAYLAVLNGVDPGRRLELPWRP